MSLTYCSEQQAQRTEAHKAAKSHLEIEEDSLVSFENLIEMSSFAMPKMSTVVGYNAVESQ